MAHLISKYCKRLNRNLLSAALSTPQQSVKLPVVVRFSPSPVCLQQLNGRTFRDTVYLYAAQLSPITLVTDESSGTT